MSYKCFKTQKQKIEISLEKLNFLRKTISTHNTKINYNLIAVLLPSIFSEIIEGVYGIWNSAIMSPYYMMLLKLPVQVLARATLISTHKFLQ